MAQITQSDYYFQFTNLKSNIGDSDYTKQCIFQSNSYPFILNSYNYAEDLIRPLQIDQETNQNYKSDNVRNIQVSRNPQQVLITKDDQYAYIRCFLSNTIEVIKISAWKIVKSFTVPSPHFCSLSNDGTKLFIASFTDSLFPPDPPEDDCSQFLIPLSGLSLLTIIDIASQEISKPDTIKTSFIRKILNSSNDSLIYFVGEEVVEYNLTSSTIFRRWQSSNYIFQSEIDNKNHKIFLTTIDSTLLLPIF